MKMFTKRQMRLICVIVSLTFLYLSIYIVKCSIQRYYSKQIKHKKDSMLNRFTKSQHCLASKNMSKKELKVVWPILPSIVEECSGEVFGNFSVHGFNGFGENKYFIDPISNDTFNCEAITLAIGGEIAAEEMLLQLYPQCKFLGIDSGVKDSETLYKTRLNGTYIEGLVGAENGTYKASILDSQQLYVEKVLPHFSFYHVTSNIFKKDVIDLLLMDIEGDEFALMKELIEKPDKYPIICQLNVEFHDPFNRKENVLDILERTSINGPYLFLKTEYIFTFNRAFFLTFKVVYVLKNILKKQIYCKFF